MELGKEEVKARALEIIHHFHPLPRLVVVDLDYTLWPFYCDCCDESFNPYLFPESQGILLALKDKGIDVAVASRSDTPDIAAIFLQKLGIQSMFIVKSQIDYSQLLLHGRSSVHMPSDSGIVPSCFLRTPSPNLQSNRDYPCTIRCKSASGPLHDSTLAARSICLPVAIFLHSGMVRGLSMRQPTGQQGRRLAPIRALGTWQSLSASCVSVVRPCDCGPLSSSRATIAICSNGNTGNSHRPSLIPGNIPFMDS